MPTYGITALVILPTYDITALVIVPTYDITALVIVPTYDITALVIVPTYYITALVIVLTYDITALVSTERRQTGYCYIVRRVQPEYSIRESTAGLMDSSMQYIGKGDTKIDTAFSNKKIG